MIIASGLDYDTVAAILTIEESVEIVVVDFTEFEKVFACFWARIYLEINDDVAQGSLEQDRHDQTAREVEEEDKCEADHT